MENKDCKWNPDKHDGEKCPTHEGEDAEKASKLLGVDLTGKDEKIASLKQEISKIYKEIGKKYSGPNSMYKKDEKQKLADKIKQLQTEIYYIEHPRPTPQPEPKPEPKPRKPRKPKEDYNRLNSSEERVADDVLYELRTNSELDIDEKIDELSRLYEDANYEAEYDGYGSYQEDIDTNKVKEYIKKQLKKRK